MLLGDGVLGVHREGDGPQPSPKRDKLPDVLHCPVVGSLILDSHAPACMASCTFHFFLVEASKMRGAMTEGFSPLTHGESQNGAHAPLPMVMRVEA